MTILEPDVVLTDYLLALISGAIALFALLRNYRLESILFLALAVAAFSGGTVHGFFPLRTETTGGWIFWTISMGALGLAASGLWLETFRALTGKVESRRFRLLVLILWLVFLAYIVVIDSRFKIAVLFYAPPLFALGIAFARNLRRERRFRYGLFAIGIMLIASVLQQLKIGIHPIFLSPNALFHILQALALPALFVSFISQPAYQRRQKRLGPAASKNF